MDEIYIVTKGRYSSYSIHKVFVDKDLAEEYAKQISDKWDDGKVEVHKIANSADLMLPVGFRTYTVMMDIDGNVDKKESYQDETRDGTGIPDYPDIEIQVSSFHGKEIKYVSSGNYRFTIVTNEGFEGAVKIANERRVQLIAENKFPKKGDVVNQAVGYV